MPDEIDRASLVVETTIKTGIARARTALRSRELEPCGVCYWCHEPLRLAGQVFCDAICAADYTDNRRRNGA
jgi:hypothetical protein